MITTKSAIGIPIRIRQLETQSFETPNPVIKANQAKNLSTSNFLLPHDVVLSFGYFLEGKKLSSFSATCKGFHRSLAIWKKMLKLKVKNKTEAETLLKEKEDLEKILDAVNSRWRQILLGADSCLNSFQRSYKSIPGNYAILLLINQLALSYLHFPASAYNVIESILVPFIGLEGMDVCFLAPLSQYLNQRGEMEQKARNRQPEIVRLLAMNKIERQILVKKMKAITH